MCARMTGDLTVITRTRELCSYVLTVTDKSPKRFRFTLVAKMQNRALDALENLFLVNEVYVADLRTDRLERRLELQHSAIANLKLLGYLAQGAVRGYGARGHRVRL